LLAAVVVAAPLQTIVAVVVVAPEAIEQQVDLQWLQAHQSLSLLVPVVLALLVLAPAATLLFFQQ
jgi:hypothetical protein